MKKRLLALVAFAFILLTGCLISIETGSLGYGEIRHEGLRNGKYQLQDNLAVYELIINGDHESSNEATATLNIYAKAYVGSSSVLLASFNGVYRHLRIIYDDDYNYSNYESFHVDELLFDKKTQNGYRSSSFNGNIKIVYDPYTAQDISNRYENGKRLTAKYNSPIKIIPVNNYGDVENRNGMPSSPWYLVP